MATFETISEGSVFYQGRPETEHSWFPGFSWLICNCSTCFQHLGWRFDAVQAVLKPARFWGLRRPALASGIARIQGRGEVDYHERGWGGESGPEGTDDEEGTMILDGTRSP